MGVPSNSVRLVPHPQGGLVQVRDHHVHSAWLERAMILIGSIAVPSYSPGIGNEVTIKIRMSSGSIPIRRTGTAAVVAVYRARIDHLVLRMSDGGWTTRTGSRRCRWPCSVHRPCNRRGPRWTASRTPRAVSR